MGRLRSRSFALAVAALAACRPDAPEPPEPPQSETPRPEPPPPAAVPPSTPPSATPAVTPAAVARPPSPYCLMGLDDACRCADLSGLVSSSDVLSPPELAWAAAEFVAVAPTALPRAASAHAVIASGASCVALTGGKVYCRADLEGAADAELPVVLSVPSACAPSGRCIPLRFEVARVCPRDGGGVTAWADSTGFSGLWGPGDTKPVPGGIAYPP